MVAYTLYDTDPRVRREAETLASTGAYDVIVFTLKNADLPRKYTLNGVRVCELNVGKYRGASPLRYILSYLHFTFVSFLAVTRSSIKHAIDVVHVHNMPNFLLFAAIVPLLQRKKLILDIHDTMPETFSSTFSGMHKRLWLSALILEERFCCKLADHVICVNHVQQAAILQRQSLANSKMTVSFNVPDPSFQRSESRTSRRETENRFKLIYHGTLAGRLSVDLAIQAVARATQSIPGIQLHVIGEGHAREGLISLCEELDLKDHVQFHKTVPLEKLVAELRDMDLGIVPLRKSPAAELMLPVKLLEYVSLGIPVVAPRLKAIQHYFTEDMLFFFEPGELPSLLRAIYEAYEDPQERRRRVQNARSFLAKFGWDSRTEGLLNLYWNVSDSSKITPQIL
jgi:glycosyltransferase involved in cell wall biosynthesis